MSNEEIQPLLANSNTLFDSSRRTIISSDKCDIEDNYDGSDLMNIRRRVYRLDDLHRETFYEPSRNSFVKSCRDILRSFQCGECIQRTFPLLQWLPQYQWRRHLIGDFISGVTVAIMHIPQGMAYALLGGVPPIVGIYMAFFPVLAYVVFGTSRHVSIGTFAIVCLMTGTVVEEYSGGTSPQPTTNDSSSVPVENLDVAVTVTATVALLQLAMYAMRLGVISSLLSDTLVNAFTCAAAFHVVASQLKDMFGLVLRRRTGNFSFLLTVYDAAINLPQANVYACTISAVTCTLLAVNNELVKPLLARRTTLPFPIELVAVVVGTVVSSCVQLNVTTVGAIPTGLPTPTLPPYNLFKLFVPQVLLDAAVIALVSYTITMSMALIFARKLAYDVDANQELLALGASNAIGSCFSCLPVAASLSRSTIQQSVGGATQLASLVSCSLLLVILLWIGPFFETLPRCVLASIIVVALKSMLVQCTASWRYWHLNRWDGAVWLVTFGATLLFQISVGLGAGILAALLSLCAQGHVVQPPTVSVLGCADASDLYLDVAHHKRGVQEVGGIKIVRFTAAGLSFATRAHFKRTLTERVGVKRMAPLVKSTDGAGTALNTSNRSRPTNIQCVILDFTPVGFIDPAGVELLRQLATEYSSNWGISLLVAGCSGPVFDMCRKCDRYDGVDSQLVYFPTVHDAVLYAKNHVLLQDV